MLFILHYPSLLIAHSGSLLRYTLIPTLVSLYAFSNSHMCDHAEYSLISSSLPRQLHLISRDPTLGT